MSGEKLNLCDDLEILSIKSPKNRLRGPWAVVYKNIKERWAIVSLTWDNRPALAIRWFWGSKGQPLSSGYPTWFIIPEALNENHLSLLDENSEKIENVRKFLEGRISGQELNQDVMKYSKGVVR